jgi:hypothetical protein
MIGAYVESLKLRVGTFIGLAAPRLLATSRHRRREGRAALASVCRHRDRGRGGALNRLDRDGRRMPQTAGRPAVGRIRRVASSSGSVWVSA